VQDQENLFNLNFKEVMQRWVRAAEDDEREEYENTFPNMKQSFSTPKWRR